MINKNIPKDIYLCGIGGTGMGAFAGLLKQKGLLVRGSDFHVYSPMKEKLKAWGIEYITPYNADNLLKKPDLVIIGNVIRRDNPESQYILSNDIPYDSFPHALKEFFLKNAIPLVITGTHGKTTTSALIAHAIKSSKKDLGYLIGGIPLNYGESFLCPNGSNSPFVVEGDEYDTAFFDKGPKFLHYCPKFLLTTSLEYDHADIYPDLKSIIKSFSDLYRLLDKDCVLVYNNEENNIKIAITNSEVKSKIFSYGLNGDYQAKNITYNDFGTSFDVYFKEKYLGQIKTELFGKHNLKNSLGAYAILHQYGLNHKEIYDGFISFKGVKRRLELLGQNKKLTLIDDFAHHPTAIFETLIGIRQRFPKKIIWVIFEPRSASSCRKVFEDDFVKAFLNADRVFIGPVARALDENIMLDTKKVANSINSLGKMAKAYEDYNSLLLDITKDDQSKVIVIMTNGDLLGQKENITDILLKQV